MLQDYPRLSNQMMIEKIVTHMLTMPESKSKELLNLAITRIAELESLICRAWLLNERTICKVTDILADDDGTSRKVIKFTC